MTARSCQDLAARPRSARSLQATFYLQGQLPAEPRVSLPSSVCTWLFRQEWETRSSGTALVLLPPVELHRGEHPRLRDPLHCCEYALFPLLATVRAGVCELAFSAFLLGSKLTVRSNPS